VIADSAPGRGDADAPTDSTGREIAEHERTDVNNTVGESRPPINPADGGGKSVREPNGPF
jgi:hypothetical protein